MGWRFQSGVFGGAGGARINGGNKSNTPFLFDLKEELSHRGQKIALGCYEDRWLDLETHNTPVQNQV